MRISDRSSDVCSSDRLGLANWNAGECAQVPEADADGCLRESTLRVHIGMERRSRENAVALLVQKVEPVRNEDAFANLCAPERIAQRCLHARQSDSVGKRLSASEASRRPPLNKK